MTNHALLNTQIKGVDGVTYTAIYKISEKLYLVYTEGFLPTPALVIEGSPIDTTEAGNP